MLFHHPCILRPIACTPCKIAMLLGLQISDAVRLKLITIERVISDIYSALRYMHSLKVIHCDVRTMNVIYLNGRARLIDFGGCKYSLYSNMGRDLIGLIEIYRDLSYFSSCQDI